MRLYIKFLKKRRLTYRIELLYKLSHNKNGINAIKHKQKMKRLIQRLIFSFVKNQIFSKISLYFKTHVCILQTAIHLLKNGFSVHVVADGCSSRSLTDRFFAFDRLRQMGSVVTTHEAVLFQLVGDKNHEKFKEIQGIVKEKGPDTGLLQRTSSI